MGSRLRGTRCRGLVVIGATLLGLLAAAPAASALTFTNSTPITIPDMGPASPYPSPITVSGLTGTVSDVNATINSFSHTCPVDVSILLVGPGGQKTLLFSDAGGAIDAGGACLPGASGVTFTLDDEAATTYPCGANPSGTFKPTNDPTGCESGPDVFPAPAPPGPYPVALTVFDGANPNGTWSLFVFDQSGGDMGTISGGWTLDLQAPDITPPTTVIGGKKIKGSTAKFRFTSNEPGSTFQCKLDKRKFKSCSSPKKYKKLSDGKHKFKVRAVDAAGNVDATPAKKKFKI